MCFIFNSIECRSVEATFICCRSVKSLSLNLTGLLKYLPGNMALLVHNSGYKKMCQNPFPVILRLKREHRGHKKKGGGLKTTFFAVSLREDTHKKGVFFICRTCML